MACDGAVAGNAAKAVTREGGMKTKGQIEAAVSEAVTKFEKEHTGRGPSDVRTYVVEDMIVVRLGGRFRINGTTPNIGSADRAEGSLSREDPLKDGPAHVPFRKGSVCRPSFSAVKSGHGALTSAPAN